MRRLLRWALGLFAGLVLLLAGGMVALVAALDAGTLTPRLTAAIEGATGRAASLGSVSLRPGMTPKLVVEGATLANPPGASRPEMARIRRIEARLALLPLLRGEVAFRSLVIDGADIVLERLANGTLNWVLRAPPREPGSTPAPAAPGPAAPRRATSIGEVVLTDSRITLPDRRLGVVEVEHARATGIGSGAAATITARLAMHGVAMVLDAEAGALPPPATPWPLRARLAIGGNAIIAEGQVGDAVTLAASVPEPAALWPLVAAMVPRSERPAILPPFEAGLRIGADAALSDATLRLGALDLAAVAPEWRLVRLEAHAPTLEGPAEVRLEASKEGLPLRITLRLDPPAALLPGAAERPVSVTLEAEAAGATARVSGRIRHPHRLAGALLDIHVAVPDLAALAPVLRDPPPLRDVTLRARLEAAGTLMQAIRLAPFSIAGPSLTAEGEVVLRPGRPIGLEGRVAIARLDVDALARRLPATAPARPTPAPAAQRAPAPAPPPAPAAEDGRVIPDIRLPLSLVRAYAGRLALTADHITVGGTDWRQMRGTLALEGGSARLTSFAAVTPGGPVRGEARLDASANPPAMSVTLRSEGRGLDLGALRRARDEAASIEGRAEVVLDLRARGATTRALAASLTGEGGVAIVDARLARAGLLRLGPDLLALLLPGAPQDGLALRCLALRFTAEDGMLRSDALLAETSAGRVEGTVAVNLRNERMAARLLPDVTLFGLRVRAPVGIGGTLASPSVGVEPGRAVVRVMEDTVANRLWRDPTIDWLAGRLTGRHPAGDCAAQLRLARFGADGPVPAPQTVVPGVPRDLQGTARDVLRGLGGILGGGRQ